MNAVGLSSVLVCLLALSVFGQALSKSLGDVNEDCPLCGPGHERNQTCGTGEPGRTSCVPCIEGKTFRSSQDEDYTCKTCLNCTYFNRKAKYKCRPQINAECGDCLSGYTETGKQKMFDGMLRPCRLEKWPGTVAPTTDNGPNVNYRQLTILLGCFCTLLFVVIIVIMYLWKFKVCPGPKDDDGNGFGDRVEMQSLNGDQDGPDEDVDQGDEINPNNPRPFGESGNRINPPTLPQMNVPVASFSSNTNPAPASGHAAGSSLDGQAMTPSGHPNAHLQARGRLSGSLPCHAPRQEDVVPAISKGYASFPRPSCEPDIGSEVPRGAHAVRHPLAEHASGDDSSLHSDRVPSCETSRTRQGCNGLPRHKNSNAGQGHKGLPRCMKVPTTCQCRENDRQRSRHQHLANAEPNRVSTGNPGSSYNSRRLREPPLDPHINDGSIATSGRATNPHLPMSDPTLEEAPTAGAQGPGHLSSIEQHGMLGPENGYAHDCGHRCCHSSCSCHGHCQGQACHQETCLKQPYESLTPTVVGNLTNGSQKLPIQVTEPEVDEVDGH